MPQEPEKLLVNGEIPAAISPEGEIEVQSEVTQWSVVSALSGILYWRDMILSHLPFVWANFHPAALQRKVNELQKAYGERIEAKLKWQVANDNYSQWWEIKKAA